MGPEGANLGRRITLPLAIDTHKHSAISNFNIIFIFF